MELTNIEHIKLYKIKEQEGNFNDEINPIDWNDCYPVTKDFPYINKNPFRAIKYWLYRTFMITPFTKKLVKKHNIKVIGEENLAGIKSAIITCNHFYIFDCLAIRHAIKNHKHKYIVAEFNNRKGSLGEYMRADGIMPLSQNYSVQKELNKAITHHLKKGNFIVCYPEQAMWYMYKKPRPFKNGAFHYAVKNNVPIIPMFITLSDQTIKDTDGLPIQNLTVHIMKPIYKDNSKTDQENIKEMKEKNYNMCKDIYEKTYNTPLVFNTKTEAKW